jgi:hypothetical protein
MTRFCVQDDVARPDQSQRAIDQLAEDSCWTSAFFAAMIVGTSIAKAPPQRDPWGVGVIQGACMTDSPKILAAVSSVIIIGLAALIALTDEWTHCHIRNWSKGYFGERNLPSGVVVSGSPGVKTIDFRRLKGVIEVCVVPMPYYGTPNFTRPMVDRGFRLERPRACWRDTEGKIVVVGRSKDAPLMWEQINVGNPNRDYDIGEKDCAEVENAVLTCRDEVCGFSQ